MQFEGAVEDWNMGTLLRANCKGDISDKNTMLGQLVEECFLFSHTVKVDLHHQNTASQ